MFAKSWSVCHQWDVRRNGDKLSWSKSITVTTTFRLIGRCLHVETTYVAAVVISGVLLAVLSIWHQPVVCYNCCLGKLEHIMNKLQDKAPTRSNPHTQNTQVELKYINKLQTTVITLETKRIHFILPARRYRYTYFTDGVTVAFHVARNVSVFFFLEWMQLGICICNWNQREIIILYYSNYSITAYLFYKMKQ